MTNRPGEKAPAGAAAPERDNRLNRLKVVDIMADREPFSSTSEISNDAEKPEGLRLTAEELINGSTVMNLEAALAIDAGKVAPVGYEQVAAFFRTAYGETRDANCVWLLAEARAAGTLDEMRNEFPDVERRAENIVTHMELEHPNTLLAMSERVSADVYSFDKIRNIQQAVASVAKLLLGNISNVSLK